MLPNAFPRIGIFDPSTFSKRTAGQPREYISLRIISAISRSVLTIALTRFSSPALSSASTYSPRLSKGIEQSYLENST
jgi:hypothetical protein